MLNRKNKLNKKIIKTIITMMLVAVFLLGEAFSPFAISASASSSSQLIKVIVKGIDNGQRVNGAKITFNGPGNSGKISSEISGVVKDIFGHVIETGVCYIWVQNGKYNATGITANKDGYEVYNIYDNDGKYYVREKKAEKDFQPNSSWMSPDIVTIELNKTSNIDNIQPTLTLTKSPTNSTSGTVTITAVATDNVAVSSIMTPDNNTVQFTPTVPSNSTTYIVSTNGTYTFIATDTSGNVTAQNINIDNIVANVAPKPQFKVTIDSHTPENPIVEDEITFKGTIHPQDFQIPIPAKEIVLVLDSSGSMQGTKIEKLKIAAKNFIKKMKDVENLKIAIVDFDTQANISNKLIPASDIKTLNSSIDNLNAYGGTNTGEGLRQTAYLLSNSTEQTSSASKTIVFMSDGEPTYYNSTGTLGGWVYGTYTGQYYTYKNWKGSINYGLNSTMPNTSGYTVKGPYTGKYTGYKYVKGTQGYYTDITKSSRDSSVKIQGTGNSDNYGYCLDYAQTVGEIIKEKGYNVFSIGYGLDQSGNIKMQKIHNSMSTVSSNFFATDTNSIDSVFNSIAGTILDSYPMTNVNFNFDPSANPYIVSIDGNTISLSNFSYTKTSQTDTTVTYSAKDVPFTIKIKSNTAGDNIEIFKNSTITFPWQSEAITANVPIQYLNISSIANGESSILEHGLYSGYETNIEDNKDLKVTNGVPVTMAMIVHAESSNPQINLSVDEKTKIQVDNTSFKEYEILENSTIGSLISAILNDNGNITGLTMQKGHKYIIIYTITPIESGQVTLTATADGTNSKSVNLNIGEKPDLF